MVYKTILFTSGSGTFIVPDDYNALVSLEAIGGGAGGHVGGGGGGAYTGTTTVNNLYPGATAYYSVGTAGGPNQNGTASWFNSTSNVAPSNSIYGVLADYGRTPTVYPWVGTGGSSATSVPNGYSGQNGGGSQFTIGVNDLALGGGGGGGCPGPYTIGGYVIAGGNGGQGINGIGAYAGYNAAGGGGGAAGDDQGGQAGHITNLTGVTNGGNGGYGYSGLNGGGVGGYASTIPTSGVAPLDGIGGSGGGGAAASPAAHTHLSGAAGSMQIAWNGSVYPDITGSGTYAGTGSGGGGGIYSSTEGQGYGGNAGGYGAGGGGAAPSGPTVNYNGSGSGGLIAFTYSAVSPIKVGNGIFIPGQVKFS